MPHVSLPGLDGNTRALVTAGAGGIGRAIADQLLACGAKVHVCDIDASAVEEFLTDQPGATATRGDVSDTCHVERLFEDVGRELGGLDVLVNNVGVSGPTAPVEDISPADWDRTVAVDLNAHFYCTRLAVPLIKAAGGGSIVNIASNAAFFGCALRAHYTACKWALLGFTRTLAVELGPHGIRVNAVCPGSVSGPRIDAVIERDAATRGVSPERVRDSYLRQSSMRRFVDATEVAGVVGFLCSDLAASISGQAIGVDGHTENLSSWV